MVEAQLNVQVDLHPELEIDLDPKIIAESMTGVRECEEGLGKGFDSIEDVKTYLIRQ